MSRSRPPTAGKRDLNEEAIIETLRAIGCSVYQLQMPVDLIVGDPATFTTILVEVKQPGKRDDLTPAERRFITQHAGPVWVVTTAEEVAARVGDLRRGA